MALYHDADGWLIRAEEWSGGVRHICPSVTDEPITNCDDRPVWEFVEYELRDMGPQRDCVLMYESKRWREMITPFDGLGAVLDRLFARSYR